MSESPPLADRHLRVGDPQRDHAIEILRGAAADGRLDFDELDARVARTLHAITRGDLAGVLEDLVPSSELDAELGSGVPIGDGPGYSWEDPLILDAGRVAVQVGGAWVVPPFIEVLVGARGVVLDFTRVRTAPPVIDIVFSGRWGGVLIVVPDGWGADLQSLNTDDATSFRSTLPTRPRRGLPRLVIRGRCLGGITLRTPTTRDLRRAASGKLRPPAGLPEIPPASGG